MMYQFQAFAVHVGSFSVEGMSEFLTGLTTGSTRTKPLEELPKIVTVEVRSQPCQITFQEQGSVVELDLQIFFCGAIYTYCTPGLDCLFNMA